MKQKYIALTLGPIKRILDKAQSTKALWGASYFISYIIKNIIQYIHKHERTFVFPVVDNDGIIFKPQSGAGLFPDRLVFKSYEADINLLTDAIDYSIGAVCSKENCTAINRQIKFMRWRGLMPSNIQKTSVTPIELKAYLMQFLTLYAAEDDFDGNVIDEFNKTLSALELQSSVLPEESIDYLSFLFENINETDLPRDAYGENNRFPSIIEIATNELSLNGPEASYQSIVDASINKAKEQFGKSLEQESKGNDKYEAEEDTLIADLKNQFKDDFKRRHKYIAIVKGDGDNMGKTFEKLYEAGKEAVDNANELILSFNIKAIDIINKYGGKSIYLGGDDLLFFAPLQYGMKTEKKADSEGNLSEITYPNNIFNLIQLICNEFDNQFAKLKKAYPEIEVPSLSFGISISYYKFPMFEALENAEDELIKAKPKNGKPKNNVSFVLQKHSGQSFGGIFSKIKPTSRNAGNADNKSTYEVFIELLKEPFHAENSFLSSIQYVLIQNEDLMSVVISDNDRLENFFDNFFSETIHNTNRKFINKIRDFIANVYALTQDVNKTRDLAYSSLRLIQFLTQSDNQDENEI